MEKPEPDLAADLSHALDILERAVGGRDGLWLDDARKFLLDHGRQVPPAGGPAAR